MCGNRKKEKCYSIKNINIYIKLLMKLPKHYLKKKKKLGNYIEKLSVYYHSIFNGISDSACIFEPLYF